MTLTILIISFVVVFSMLAHKMWEVRRGNRTLITVVFMLGDHIALSFYRQINNLFRRQKEHTIFFFLVHLPSRIEKFFSKLKRRSHDKYHSLSEKVRGKRNFNTGGSASPFMRTLTRGGSDNAGGIM